MAQHDDRGQVDVRLRNYLTGPFLDFQQSAFSDRVHGGFHETLDLAGDPLRPGHKRLLTQCRQLFVHSHAALLPGAAPINETACAGFEFLTKHYWDNEHGGWFFQTDASGAAVDHDKDLYGHAFVVFALSYYHRASDDTRALEAANRTLDVIDSCLCATSHGGFIDRATRSWEPFPGERRQNPHMHLLEAYLAYREAGGDRDVDGSIRDLVRLAQQSFVDPATGTLGEFFRDDWRPDPDRGHIVEPGHHFEWAWLLDWVSRVTEDCSVLPLADDLFAWGCRHGVDRNTGGVIDEVDRTGNVIRSTRRVWPQMEYMKALAAQLRRYPRADLRARLVAASEHVLDHYLLADGRWHEHLDADGQPTRAELPGTSGYHIFLGLLEAATALGQRAQRLDSDGDSDPDPDSDGHPARLRDRS